METLCILAVQWSRSNTVSILVLGDLSKSDSERSSFISKQTLSKIIYYLYNINILNYYCFILVGEKTRFCAINNK